MVQHLPIARVWRDWEPAAMINGVALLAMHREERQLRGPHAKLPQDCALDPRLLLPAVGFKVMRDCDLDVSE